MSKVMSCLFFIQPNSGSKPKGTKRNKIRKMDMFYSVEIGKLKYVYHIIDNYSGFLWATGLSFVRLIL